MNVSDDYFRRDLPSPLGRSPVFLLSKIPNVFLATEPVGGRVRGRPQAQRSSYRFLATNTYIGMLTRFTVRPNPFHPRT